MRQRKKEKKKEKRKSKINHLKNEPLGHPPMFCSGPGVSSEDIMWDIMRSSAEGKKEGERGRGRKRENQRERGRERE